MYIRKLIFKCIALFLLEFQSDFEPATFIMDFLGILCSLMWPSIFCYFADWTTERISKMGDTVYGFNWFDQPVKMQKFMILMIARSQERIYFSGLGLVTCSLEAFGKVCISFNLNKTRFDIGTLYSYHFFNFYLQLLNSACSFYVVFRRETQI